MSLVPAQQAVAEYHRKMSQHGHHGGHDMYIFHCDWHAHNRDPQPPMAPNRNWGTNPVYGTNFLQMHHEVVKAAAGEQKFHMLHDSLFAWYARKGYDLPPQ